MLTLRISNRLQVRCRAKRMTENVKVFFLPLNGFTILVTIFGVTRFLENHETTHNEENVKIEYEESSIFVEPKTKNARCVCLCYNENEN